MRAFLFVAFTLTASAQAPLPEMLSRLSEEAEVFWRMAPQVVAEEILEQKALKLSSWFSRFMEESSGEPPKLKYQAKQIISEYSLGVLKDSPDSLHEFRQVISVDGRKVRTAQQAEHSLVLGLRSAEERDRRRMLHDFEKRGLLGAAVDFGTMIMLFTKRRMGNYRFQLSGEGEAGRERARIISYEQIAGPETFLIFERRKVLTQPVRGRIFIRKSDGLPVRIDMVVSREEHQHKVHDEATVDYILSPHGLLVPASIVHHSFVDKLLVVEHRFIYRPFKKFSVDSSIQF